MKTRFFTFLMAVACLTACNKEDDSYDDGFSSRALPSIVTNNNPKAYTKDDLQKNTLESLTRVDASGELYRMDYVADYGLNAMIAAGGVKSNAELLGYAQRYLLNIPTTKSLSLDPNFGCSAFMVKSQDGHYLFCRNFDYVIESPVSVITRTSSSISTFCMNMAVNTTKSGTPDDGVSDNSFYVAAPLAIMDGMNDYGVAICVLVVMSYGAEQHAEGKSNLTTTAVMREILDNAKNVDEALAIFDSHNFYAHGGTYQSNYHFFLADASGRSVVVEYVNSGRNNQSDTNYEKVVTDAKYVTNNFLYESFREPLSDTWREALIESRINDVKGKTDAFKLLLDATQIHDKDLNRNIKPGETAGVNSFPSTMWSVVYDLTEKQAYYITGREHLQGLKPFMVPMMQK